MLSILSKELLRRPLLPLKNTQRFFTNFVIPHTQEYLLLQEFKLKELNISYERSNIAQGERILMCDTEFGSNIILGARPSFLKEDISSIFHAREDLMHFAKTMHASFIEFELKKDIQCLTAEIIPGQRKYYLHLDMLKFIQFLPIQKFFAFENLTNETMKPKK